ncbi:MAG: hypothetical protein WC780_13195 [Lentimicrobiaceae bacterium]
MLLSTIPFLQQIASALGTCASIQSRARLAMTCTPGRSYQRTASKATAATTKPTSKATVPTGTYNRRRRHCEAKPQQITKEAQAWIGFAVAILCLYHNAS